MRINCNPHTSTSDSWDWVDELVDRFFAAHHVDKTGSEAYEFGSSPKGIQVMVGWLKEQGYDIKYWELDFVLEKTQLPIAYGFDFNDACPKIVEHKLRHLEDVA